MGQTLQARTLEWASFPSSRGSSWPRDRIWISCIAGRLFSVWAPGKPYVNISKSTSDDTHSYNHCAVGAEPQSGVWLSETAGTAGRHAPLSSGISQSLLKFISIELVILSNHLILCRPLLLPSIFPSIKVFFQRVSSSHQVAKVLELQHINPSNEYSGLISFRIDGLDLLAVQGTQTSSAVWQFQSIHSSALSLLYGPTLPSVHDYWKDHSFDYANFCQQSDVSAF